MKMAEECAHLIRGLLRGACHALFKQLESDQSMESMESLILKYVRLLYIS